MKKAFTTKQMALDALLAAVCAVLGYYGPDFGNLKITFEGLPVIVAALLLSPLDGALVGGIGTLLYQILRYGVTATTPLWILPYVLCGLLVGRIADRCAPEKSYLRLGLTVLAGEGLIFLLNTGVIYLDSKIYGYYSFAYVFGSFFVRLGICAAKTALYTAVLPTLLSALRQQIEAGGGQAVFLVFQFDRTDIYRAQYNMIHDVLGEIKLDARQRELTLSVLELDSSSQ